LIFLKSSSSFLQLFRRRTVSFYHFFSFAFRALGRLAALAAAATCCRIWRLFLPYCDGASEILNRKSTIKITFDSDKTQIGLCSKTFYSSGWVVASAVLAAMLWLLP
jgi:hypothetical protein